MNQAPSSPAAPAENRPSRVLIVDDEAPARRRMRDVLGDCTQAYPLEIVGEAESGQQGLALAQTLQADLLFVDIRMADMDGLELARHLLKPVRTARLLTALQKVLPLTQ